MITEAESTNRIALCMIVRDEASFLPGCLASVVGAVDEMIVVDTGSVDATRAIARDHGATVIDHAWDDDFAAARNAALPHVRAPWVLVLDADERLAPGGGEALRRGVAEGGFELGMLPLHDATRLSASPADVLSGAARRGEPILLPRLLRRTPDLAWRGVVHESVDAWWLARRGVVRHLQAPILHFGAVPEVRAARAKDARNLALLRKRCALEPEAPQPHAYLAVELLRLGDVSEADAVLERGFAALVAAARAGLRPAVVPLATLRAGRALERGQPMLALETIASARELTREHPNFAWSCARAYAALGDRARAQDAVRAVLASTGDFADEVLEGIRGWRGRLLLATLTLEEAPGEALRLVECALDERPSEEASLLRAECLIVLGRPVDALHVLEPWVAEDSAEGWTLAASAAAALGDGATARLFAARIGPRAVAPRRYREMQRALA